MLNRLIHTVWEPVEILASSLRSRRWLDILLLFGIFGFLFGFLQVGQEWTAFMRPQFEIDLSPWALPRYTFYTMTRGLLAYLLSLGFTFVYAYWVAKDERSEKFLIPLLDILQSIPTLSFLLPLLIAFVQLFPNNNIGLELTAIITIFTSQVWNMTFDLYYSLKTVPPDLAEVGRVFRFNWYQRFKWIELPYGATGLAWNSMLSMAGGWFFLMVIETIRLGNNDYRLPGLGSYMVAAVEQGNRSAIILGLLATFAMVIFLDQILWRPIVVWTQRFDTDASSSRTFQQHWFLNILKESSLIRQFEKWRKEASLRRLLQQPLEKTPSIRYENFMKFMEQVGPKLSFLFLTAIVVIIGIGSVKIFRLLAPLTAYDWLFLLKADAMTLGRVILSTLLGLLWALPVGLMIGLSPRVLKIFQPVVQIVASFPSSMLFPIMIAFFAYLKISLAIGSVLLMLLATQWYILFNVIAGASMIPSELREASAAFNMNRWQTFKSLYFPSILPHLVTGCLTAAGAAWNASIVCEYVTLQNQQISTFGLGSVLSLAGANGNGSQLAAATLVLATTVVLFNRLVWKRLYELAETRYSLIK